MPSQQTDPGGAIRPPERTATDGLRGRDRALHAPVGPEVHLEVLQVAELVAHRVEPAGARAGRGRAEQRADLGPGVAVEGAAAGELVRRAPAGRELAGLGRERSLLPGAAVEVEVPAARARAPGAGDERDPGEQRHDGGGHDDDEVLAHQAWIRTGAPR